MSESTRKLLITIAFVCLVLSAGAIIMASYFSGDWKDLLKLSMPATILFIVMYTHKRRFNRKIQVPKE